METLIKKEINILEKDFSETDLEDSWYYIFLKRVGKINSGSQNSVKKIDDSIDVNQIKQSLIEYTNTLEKTNLANKLMYFIKKYSRNLYYFNIIKAVVSIIKITSEGFTLEEAKQQVYKDNINFSGFELTIIDSILNNLYYEENKQIKLHKEQNLTSL